MIEMVRRKVAKFVEVLEQGQMEYFDFIEVWNRSGKRLKNVQIEITYEVEE